MAIPNNITKEHILSAIKKIDVEGIPSNAHSTQYDLVFNDSRYPPKLVLSWANIPANGSQLDRETFSGGRESQCFKTLESLGFVIDTKLDAFIGILQTFITDVKAGTLKTKHYPKTYKGLKVKVSFGQGALAKIPWIALLQDGQKVSDGVYPVVLFYKEFNEIVFANGVSEENEASWRWTNQKNKTIAEYLQEKYGVNPSRYSDSNYVDSIDPNQPLDNDKASSIIGLIIEDYKDVVRTYEKELESLEEGSEKVNAYENKPQYLNQILYGPPGTGKTYNSINTAVELLSPLFFNANKQNRSLINNKYHELKDAGLISYVTFHQSYSYEDFVEGLKPDVSDTGNITYEVQDGIFKKLCLQSKVKVTKQSTNSVPNLQNRRIWKMSLGNTLGQDAYIFDQCCQNNVIALGYGHGLDFTNVSTKRDVEKLHINAGVTLKSNNDYSVASVYNFKVVMAPGDIIVVSDGNHKFRAIAEVSGDYFFDSENNEDQYVQMRKVNWLKVFSPSKPKEELFSVNLSQMTLYRLKQPNISLRKLEQLINNDDTKGISENKNSVLIIDEINRGNIANIFGELITLIEPDKREGKKEEISVTLPYSRTEFSVPPNVYLVGTMNTADKSLVQIDIALRRRFHFIEMLPDYDLLESITMPDNINISALLKTINSRIELIFDREHMIGHSFFMNLKSEPTVDKLKEIFELQLLPLLEEYFYEDWEKVRIVLGDHLKTDQSLCFLKPKYTEVETLKLLGDKVNSEENIPYVRNESALLNPNAYLTAYDTKIED